MTHPENGRITRLAAKGHTRSKIVECPEILLDVDLRLILQRNQQCAACEITVSDLTLGKFDELPSGSGRMDEEVHISGLGRPGTHRPAAHPNPHNVKPERTEAIILHTLPARERDKLVVFLTPDHGKRKGWAYGARSIRSRFGASLEPLSKVRIGYIEKEADEVVRIESVDLVRSLFPAQQNLGSSVAASYIAETVDTFSQSGDPSELTYRLLDRTTEALLCGATPLSVVAYAEIWILRLAGILPSLRSCIQCDALLQRPLRFDGRVAGFVCESCAGRESETLPNEVADALDALMRLPCTEFAARQMSSTVLFDIRSLASGFRRNFLGHELKSFEILAGVIAMLHLYTPIPAVPSASSDRP